MSRGRWLAVMASVCVVVTLALSMWHRSHRPGIRIADDSIGIWPVPTGDGAGLRYSALDQINRLNVDRLEVAWTYRTGDLERLSSAPDPHGLYTLQVTPILAAGRLLGCTHSMVVFALDPETGRQLWRFDPQLPPAEGGAGFYKCRGVSAWIDDQLPTDAACRTRVIIGAGLHVYALDAVSGRRCPGFGADGVASVAVSSLVSRDEVQLRSPGAIVNDVIVFGSAMMDAYRRDAPSGKVRAFDLRTGALRWEYDPIPHDPADAASATWQGHSSTDRGGANVWSQIAVDQQRGLVYLPTTSPANDYYGADRPGDNLWTDSVVALDANTGRQLWAFQTTHHDTWDRDLPTQPILVDIERDRSLLPAAVQLTKQGFVFVLDRVTGEPIYPVEERPVPHDTDVPGERLSPTQPVPTVIPPLGPTTLSPEDAWGFTPFDRHACRKLIASLRHGELYEPISLTGTIVYPGLGGGATWGGGAVDIRSRVMFVPTMHIPLKVKLTPRSSASDDSAGLGYQYQMLDSPYVAEVAFVQSPLGAPCSAPPWSRLTAVDLDTGKILWAVPLGSIEKQAWYAPPLMLGTPFSGGPIATAGGLVFMAGTTDQKIRAFDVDDGRILWTGKLPAAGMATPMTYSVKGRQYVVIAAGGSQFFGPVISDAIVAFALD